MVLTVHSFTRERERLAGEEAIVVSTGRSPSTEGLEKLKKKKRKGATVEQR